MPIASTERPRQPGNVAGKRKVKKKRREGELLPWTRPHPDERTYYRALPGLTPTTTACRPALLAIGKQRQPQRATGSAPPLVHRHRRVAPGAGLRACEATRGIGNRDAGRRRRRGRAPGRESPNLPVLSARPPGLAPGLAPERRRSQQLSQLRSLRLRACTAAGVRGVPWSGRRRDGRPDSLGVTHSGTEVRGRMREDAPRIPVPCFRFLYCWCWIT
ncbi:hypothetical protein PVAP13_3NG138201 [Panicum virgatum]|uniref:Uncharacterized protein n=1 Tax=Panicum virgatum TaxID=38727 RepID=A0A8T0UAU4_PANVG|nr:hypothetical protein PVAP13_3NG138201 [Panicum virgatum]